MDFVGNADAGVFGNDLGEQSTALNNGKRV
jgi:hypothetical protein